MQLVDSHCHLNFPELFGNLDFYLEEMKKNEVAYALCVSTRPDNLDVIVQLANSHPHLFASVGIHPDEKLSDVVIDEPYLLKYVSNPKVIAIGETGLDYYHTTPEESTYQHERFIVHINVARQSGLPLIIHTRNSIEDTVRFLDEYDASGVGGVMHCFTENTESARKCLDLGFYISISGVVTFKNATQVQEMAQYVPLDRLLVETDSPFLAPVPFRGKTNHPALVRNTAQYLADLKGMSLASLAEVTTNNFFNLFKKATRLI